MKTVSYTQMRKELADILDYLQEGGELTVTRRGQPDLVLSQSKNNEQLNQSDSLEEYSALSRYNAYRNLRDSITSHTFPTPSLMINNQMLGAVKRFPEERLDILREKVEEMKKELATDYLDDSFLSVFANAKLVAESLKMLQGEDFDKLREQMTNRVVADSLSFNDALKKIQIDHAKTIKSLGDK